MKGKLNTIYISDRLKAQLGHIPHCPLTTVVAPAGYGKSIAVRYFTGKLPKTSLVLWQNVLGASTTDFWRGFCDMASTVSADLAMALRSMGGPPADGTTQREFLRVMGETFGGKESVYVVIDDFHLVMNQELYDFVGFCTRSMGANMHLILISRRPILRSEDMLLFAGHVNELTDQDLRFGVEDIQRYFAHCGCPIPAETAVHLAQLTEGWISAIYLNLKSLFATGRFADSVEIHTMMSEVLYAPLPPEQKQLLTTMSILLEWTAEQAAFIGDCADAEPLLKEMLRNNAFLYYSAYNGHYKLHHLLQESVQKVFVDLPQERRRHVYARAGEWFRRAKDYILSMQFFYAAADFEHLMCTVEEGLGATINAEHKDQMLRWFRECPEEILDAHPVAMLVYARRLYTFNMRSECKEVFRRLRDGLAGDQTISPSLRQNILGEIEVNESFLEYNDIAAMSQHHRRACQLLDRPTISISPEAAWEFGGVSTLLDYHRKAGELEREVQVMKDSMPFWYRINCNQGSGAEHLMEAERCLMMGELDDAAICLHRAWNNCVRDDRVDMQIMTAFSALHLDLLRGGCDRIVPTIKSLREKAQIQKQYMLLHTLDMAEAWFSALLGRTEPCAEWIAHGNLGLTRQLFPATSTLQMVYRQVLLAQGSFAALIGREEGDRAMTRIFPNLACELFLDIQLAAAYEGLGKREEAAEHLNAALNMAMPDRMMLPFALLAPWIGSLLEDVTRTGNCPEREQLMAMAEDYLSHRRAVLGECAPQENRFDLSQRELEIAHLAARRMTNREIAQALHISENTVKSSLRIIFQKLGLEQGGRGKKKELERLLGGSPQ